ncbi:hypothetical protein E3Q06_00216 [Wallemia mellicola]|nr:hypothetical protein E3Q21_00679 [Wallemia mellicola]TIB91670.1 hypothetical protein E3Q20_00665 [Wallemia mellicola]TIC44052.1 hypothetical protein E3Q07_00216 [Wallemia mellicola]TIC53268.1 hypothetical protein E3Q06_00216 [Wallemia mellicola]
MFFKSSLLATIAAVAAHGTVSQIDVSGGQSYKGPLINSGDRNSPIWHVSTSDPTTNLQSGNMFCGPDATSGGQSPSIGAGSTLTIHWGQGYTDSGDQWPHNTGPIMTYMAKCNGDCSNADSGSTKFFKISELGIENGQWVQAQLKQGQPYSVQIPSDLQAGNYLLRTEIDSLHSGIEIYPSCSQWTITGDGSNAYDSSATASFPGAYSSSDASFQGAGSSIYNVQSDSSYQFPGPEPVTSGQSSSSSGSTGGNSNNVAAQQSTSSSESQSTSSAESQPTSTQQSQAQPTSSSSGSNSGSGSSGSSSGGDCNSQYEQCIQAWVPGSGNFDCQTEFVSCQQQSLGRRQSAMQGATKRSSSMKRSQMRHARNQYRRKIRF